MFDGLDATAQAHYVAPAQLMVWADRVRPFLAKITDESGGRFVGPDLLTAIAAGRIQLWIALRDVDLMCVMLTDVQQYPRLRALRIFALVGHKPRVWMSLLPAVEAAAKRDFGCSIVECVHDPRFSAILPGYCVTHAFSEKSL